MTPRIPQRRPRRDLQLPRASEVLGRLSKLLGPARWLGTVLIVAALTAGAQGQSSVTLAWDPSPGGAIAGYRIYQGGTSRTYTNVIAAGNVTNKAVSNLAAGATYYFAVTAYDTNALESDYSSEVSYTVTLPTNGVVTNVSGAGTLVFSNPSAIAIPDSGAGTPYPSTISVSGMGGLISNLTLTLRNLSHTWVSDVDVLLVGPAGQKVLVLANAGDAFAANNVTVTLSDAAASALPSSGSFIAGTYKPTAYTPTTVFPSPAPPGPYATTLSTLNGLSANGTWSLYVMDDGAHDQGSFAGGWSLTVTTVSATGAAPTISDIPNQTTTVNTATAAVPFTVNDTDTAVGTLALSGGSSNPTLVPTNKIVFGGSGGIRTVTVTPAANQAGTATITVSVSDGTNRASDAFVLTVNTVSLLPAVALTAPFNGASYTAPATINLAASVTANGHTITKLQFYNGATLLAEDASAPYSYVWTNVAAGSYSLTARAVYGSGSTVVSASANLTVTSLLPPWQAADIGTMAVAGNASVSGGLCTVTGAGKISGSADSFRFLYQTLSGDGEIRARISSVQNTATTGRIGVMIRESLTSGSKYTFMGISPEAKFRWQRRINTGGTTASTTSGTGTPPNAWARLVRTNGMFYGYKSANGTSWTLVGSRAITMATNIHVGLAVASGSSSVLNSSTFTNVIVVP